MVGYDVSTHDRSGPRGRRAAAAVEPAFEPSGAIAEELHAALAEGQFRVAYQPIVALDGGHVTGVEAFLRWQHPRLGLLPASKFVTVAEETGLIVPVGEQVLFTACQQVADRNRASGHPWRVSVNVSRRQLEEPGIDDVVAGILGETGLDPSLLQIEVTEATLTHASFAAIAGLVSLHSGNVTVGLDDFGSGYSSLASVHRISLDSLKIDERLVARVGAGRVETATIHSIVALARALDIDCIAEGVETAEQAARLSDIGASHGQGHHYCVPAPLEYLASWSPHTPVRSSREQVPEQAVPEQAVPEQAVPERTAPGSRHARSVAPGQAR